MFIDLKKAYDSIDRDCLWKNFCDNLGLPVDIVKALKLMYCNLKVKLKEDKDGIM